MTSQNLSIRPGDNQPASGIRKDEPNIEVGKLDVLDWKNFICLLVGKLIC